MDTVKQLLKTKGQQIWSITPDASVYEAIEQMNDHGVGALLVMENEKLIGVISERDYARKTILKGRSSKTTPVRDIMTRKVIYISPKQTLEECMALMTDKRVRHLPVFVGEKLIGIISIGDVLKAIITDKKFIIDQLESYITGS